MKELTDEKIRTIAEQAGFWGVNSWWRHAIPMFRKFLELALKGVIDDVT